MKSPAYPDSAVGNSNESEGEYNQKAPDPNTHSNPPFPFMVFFFTNLSLSSNLLLMMPADHKVGETSGVVGIRVKT